MRRVHRLRVAGGDVVTAVGPEEVVWLGGGSRRDRYRVTELFCRQVYQTGEVGVVGAAGEEMKDYWDLYLNEAKVQWQKKIIDNTCDSLFNMGNRPTLIC